MSRKYSIGKPKRDGPFQDFPLIDFGKARSISEWLDSLPVVEDSDDEPDIDNIQKNKSKIAERKQAISNEIARLSCIRNVILDIKGGLDDSISECGLANNQAQAEATIIDNQSVEPDYCEDITATNEIEQPESIWQRVSKKTSDLYYKAGVYVGKAMFAAGNLSFGKLIAKPEMKYGENLAEYERRVKRIGMIKVLGLTVLSIVATHGVKDIVDSYIQNNYVPRNGTSINHAQFDSVINSSHIESTTNVNNMPDFSYDAFNVMSGEGIYDTMNQMGITDSAKQFEIINKIGPELQNMGVAYPTSDGLWGFTKAGELPREALELIWNNK